MGFITRIPGATTPGSLQDSAFPNLTSNNPALNQQLNRFKTELFTPLKVAGTMALEAMNKITRAPWIITCDSWISDKNDDPKFIILGVNPKRVAWNMPFRTSMVKTAAGTVTFVWRDPNRKNTVFDEPTLEITLQSASILPVLSTAGQIKEQIVGSISRATPDFPFKNTLTERINNRITGGLYTSSDGLNNFYRFLELYNIPRLNEDTGEPNYIRLIMNTLLFPKLTLRGQFVADEPISFEESSGDQTQIEWTIKFVVHDTVPNITSAQLSDLLDIWKSSGGDSGFRSPQPEDIESMQENLREETFKNSNTDEKGTDITSEQRERQSGSDFPEDSEKADAIKDGKSN